MNRLGLGLASAALVVGSACGGGSDQPEAVKTTVAKPTLDLLSVGQACVQAEMISDGVGGEPGSWPIPTYSEYGGEIAQLARESVPKVAEVLQPIGEQALKIGTMSGDEDSIGTEAGAWSTEYQKLVDLCARTDSPITRLSY